MAEVQVPRLPLEVARDQAVALFSRAGAMLLQAMIDRFGSEETYRIVYPYFKQLGKEIAALAICRDAMRDVGGFLLCRNFGCSDGGIAGILDDATQASRIHLCRQAGRE